MSRAVVAQELQRALRARGMKQTELAIELGVDPATINRWLRGNALPKPKLVPLLASVLGIDESKLSQTVMAALQGETRTVRREASETRAMLDEAIGWMREVVVENRDINRDIRDGQVQIAGVLGEIVNMLDEIRRTLESDRRPRRRDGS